MQMRSTSDGQQIWAELCDVLRWLEWEELEDDDIKKYDKKINKYAVILSFPRYLKMAEAITNMSPSILPTKF